MSLWHKDGLHARKESIICLELCLYGIRELASVNTSDLISTLGVDQSDPCSQTEDPHCKKVLFWWPHQPQRLFQPQDIVELNQQVFVCLIYLSFICVSNTGTEKDDHYAIVSPSSGWGYCTPECGVRRVEKYFRKRKSFRTENISDGMVCQRLFRWWTSGFWLEVTAGNYVKK